VSSQRQAALQTRGRGQPNKRQKIIEAARAIFARDGFTNASVDTIAAEADVSKQTIYNNFEGKEALFEAAVLAGEKATQSEPDAAGLEETVANSNDLDRDLRELGQHWIASVLREDVAAFRRVILAEWDRHPDLLSSWKRPRPELRRALARGIGRQVERGVLEIDDVDLAARQLILLVITEALTRALYGMRKLSTREIGDIVGSGVAMWLRCYRVRNR
jgi:TetR/AcrR family transcriptional regulator, mexJK operon transcriptional repressor